MYEITNTEIVLIIMVGILVGIIAGHYDSTNGGCTGLIVSLISIVVALALYVLAFKKPID